MPTPKLPAHVYRINDRHGKVRYRFIRKGWKSAYLNAEPGSAEFHADYAELLAGGPKAGGAALIVEVKARSMDDLFIKAKQTVKWEQKKERTRHVQSQVIQRFLDRKDKKGRRYGSWPAAAVTVAMLDGVFASMSETPAAANVLRKTLSGLFHQAVKMQWRTDNPIRFTDAYPENKVGFHDWTDAEIEQYRGKHALGTMARPAMELALNTAARRCDVAEMTRDDIPNGRIAVAHVKGNEETSVPLMATTIAALKALPVAPIRYLIVSERGTPFTAASFGNRFRKWCNEAGLPHCSIHGLRKAMSRQLAEAGATDAEGQAVTGHKKASTFQHYRAKANRVKLADKAFSNLAARDISNPKKKGDK